MSLNLLTHIPPIAYTPYTTINGTVHYVTGKTAVWKNYNGSDKPSLLSGK